MPSKIQTNWTGFHIEKDELRAEIWSLLKKEKATVRDPFGHIPNFINAKKAADVLANLPIWQQAKTIKCNPDSPHIPVRSRALEDGKCLYMAVPRLTSNCAFVELTPQDLRDRNIPFEEAAIAKKALTYGRLVSCEEMEAIDLVVVGCVAVTRNGGRTGKGAGFADLELAMLKTFGLVQDDTPIVTTVHPLQIVEDSRLPMLPHDWALNWIITTEGAIATHTNYPRPDGLDWEAIRPEQYNKIPILRRLKK